VVDFLREQLRNLLEAVVQGDQGAFERLSELYTPLIRSMSARFIESLSAQNDAGLIDVQDLEQEARLALFRAVNSYNRKQQDVSFGLYAKICIRNAFISQLRKAKTSRARKEKANRHVPRQAEDPLLSVISEEEAVSLKGKIRQVLSSYENEIFEQYISGRPVRDIADSVGRPEKSVSNAVYRIRVKIRGLLKQ
jgi:RNA polymerase sporulation-specific sigma factor